MKDAASIALLREIGAQISPEDEELNGWLERYRHTHLERLALDLRLVEELSEPGSRILEVGAVPLLLTAALQRRGYRVTGLDVDPDRFKSAIEQHDLEVIRCDIEREPVPASEACFDLVLFNELFEHLRINPVFTFREIRRVLAPGGRLVISTPNLRSLRGLRNLIVHGVARTGRGGIHDEYQKLETLGHMGHVREYTPRELREFLDALDLETERVTFRGGHGRGVVGLLERVLPQFRPSFVLVARKPQRHDPTP